MRTIIKPSNERKKHNSVTGENLAIAEYLAEAERSRAQGIQGYSVEQFEQNMREAIKKGGGHGTHR